jgi:hypothetical protein
VALFVGMPLIFYPIPFIFVAGGFDTAFTELLFSAGMIRMLSHTADVMQAQATTASSAVSVALPPFQPSVGACNLCPPRSCHDRRRMEWRLRLARFVNDNSRPA